MSDNDARVAAIDWGAAAADLDRDGWTLLP
ncbi:MAG: hypothetical protein JWN69_1580, partial [Alphaproteobacteria bacterium]|nr:hypothetical protein [Alphaproteobacteria bacterium]